MQQRRNPLPTAMEAATAPTTSPQEYMVGGSGDPGGLSLQAQQQQGGHGRRFSDAASLMMGSGRDVDDERERMGHNLRDR